LKYNLHHEQRNWIETLVLEAETAISNLDTTGQNYSRLAVAKIIKNIKSKGSIYNKINKN
jgi:hypothetical protein